MLEPIIKKQVEFAKSHSNVKDALGACIFKGRKLWVIGCSHLPLKFKYTSEKAKQLPELHITAVMDAIMKIGSYKHTTYSDLDIAVSDPLKVGDIALIVEMGFKTLWIGDDKFDPAEHFRQHLKGTNVSV